MEGSNERPKTTNPAPVPLSAPETMPFGGNNERRSDFFV